LIETSPFFRGALKGRFREITDHAVRLPEDNVNTVDCFAQWLYGDDTDLSPPKTNGDGRKYAQAVADLCARCGLRQVMIDAFTYRGLMKGGDSNRKIFGRLPQEATVGLTIGLGKAYYRNCFKGYLSSKTIKCYRDIFNRDRAGGGEASTDGDIDTTIKGTL
jgi:hypothetical protein